MLHYQSTSYHDVQYLRQVLGLRPAPEFESWLLRMGIVDEALRLLPVTRGHRLLRGVER
jgi:ethanolamine ammonia-lyase large subunit